MLKTADLPALEAAPAQTAPLALPEIKTVETDFDRFKARRARFVESLKSAGDRQCHGHLKDGDRVCFVGLGDEIRDGGA